MSDAQSPAASGRHNRSAKNYLIDRNFQLKYTAFLVGIALALSVILGLILWRTSSEVIEQSQSAVEQGRETVKQGQQTIDRGKQVLVQSRRVSQVVAMNIAK
ncbi:MAG: HAMP domain-containing protein, partial [Byssovorax sp.]